jgi:hypothetical protein
LKSLLVTFVPRSGRATATIPASPTPVAQRPIPGAWFVAGIALSLALLAALMQHTKAVFDIGAPINLPYYAAIGLLAAIRWYQRNATSRPLRALRDMAEYAALFMAISLIGATASYPVAALSHGFADAALQRADAALGFDWLAWYRFTAAHPAVQVVSRSAYAMIYVSPAILLGYLSWAGRKREARDFLAAVAIAAAITLFAFSFMPAIGPFAYLWHGPIAYLPVSDLWQPQLIPQLREHTAPALDLGHLVGLVSAPSFHAAAAVLLIMFALPTPQAVRAVLLVVNAAMLLSTPVEGTHYLTDMILGAGVAFVAIGAVRGVRMWLGSGDYVISEQAELGNVVPFAKAA